MSKDTTLEILELVYQISKELGKNPLEIIEMACKNCGIEIPNNVMLETRARKNLDKIKIGDFIKFEITNIENLEDEKIYLFKAYQDNQYYDVWGKYITGNKGEYLILSDEEFILFDKDVFKPIGILRGIGEREWKI